ncbi:DUF6082 family protein [Streptomyces sp. NBC_01537]|uniref:DUF6082 family protein n=1 Tax=Streptomyces sp. NBC_01537 TaxID=2903896 RepID=UPI003866C836
MSAIDRRRAKPVLRFLCFAVLAAAGCALASIVMTLVPGLRTTASGNAGQAYGAAASSSAVMVLFYMAKTLRLQRKETSLQRQELELQREEMRLQRTELELQRQEMRRSAGELHRSAEAELRSLHMQLLKLAIADPDLAEVWPESSPGLSAKRNRQYLYANLIYCHVMLVHRLSKTTDLQIVAHMRNIVGSPLFRAYWEAGRSAREELEPGTQEHHFAALVEEAMAQTADRFVSPDLRVVDQGL